MLILASAYVAAQMLADITSLKIVTVMGLAMDAGTFVYPITFTLRDLVHKATGAQGARVVIISAAVINLFMAGLFAFVARLPGDPNVGAQQAFGQVLAPVWRITLASIAAEVVSQLVDTEIYRLWVEHVTRRYQWLRVLTSNGVSVPVDSMLFAWAAFGGTHPSAVVWGIVASNVIIKTLTTFLSLPLIYAVPQDNVAGDTKH